MGRSKKPKMDFNRFLERRHLTLTNATEAFEFEVDDEDAALAFCKKGQFCAAANGLMRMVDKEGLPMFDMVNVGRKAAHLQPRGSRQVKLYGLEALLKSEVDLFDKTNGRHLVKTGKYKLLPVSESEVKRSRRGGRDSAARRAKRPHRLCTLCVRDSKGKTIVPCNRHQPGKRRLGERFVFG